MLSVQLVAGCSLIYIALLFVVAFYADRKQEQGQSIISNPHIYSLSIAVYATTWTYYGSVGKAATTGMDFLPIYLGPSLTAFVWWFFLRKIVRISKENNITSIADFISSRYGKSQWLGALITIIAILGIMPYMALQLKAVSTTFTIITGYPGFDLRFTKRAPVTPPGFFAAASSVSSVLFSAPGTLFPPSAMKAWSPPSPLESIVKLVAFMTVGIFVTYSMFDGFARYLLPGC